MPLPLLAAGARVAAKRAVTTAARPARNAERHMASASSRLTPRRRPGGSPANRMLRSRNMVRGLRKGSVEDSEKKSLSGSLINRARAVSASVPTITMLGPLYLSVQLPFALVGLAALGFESLVESVTFGWMNGISPGRPIFIAAYIATTLIAVASMAIAGIMYAVRGISWWQNHSQIWFTVFLAFSMVPILNTLPWVFAWMLTVIYEQR